MYTLSDTGEAGAEMEMTWACLYVARIPNLRSTGETLMNLADLHSPAVVAEKAWNGGCWADMQARVS